MKERMTPEGVVDAMTAAGFRAELIDLPGCPGSHMTPFPCAHLSNGNLLSVGNESDKWPVLGEPMEERLHAQVEFWEGPEDEAGQYVWADLSHDDLRALLARMA